MNYALIGGVVGLAGLLVTAANIGWAAAFGIFLMLIGNNMERSARK